MFDRKYRKQRMRGATIQPQGKEPGQKRDVSNQIKSGLFKHHISQKDGSGVFTRHII